MSVESRDATFWATLVRDEYGRHGAMSDVTSGPPWDAIGARISRELLKRDAEIRLEAETRAAYWYHEAEAARRELSGMTPTTAPAPAHVAAWRREADEEARATGAQSAVRIVLLAELVEALRERLAREQLAAVGEVLDPANAELDDGF